jgi:formate dehydrogenase (coenzyme F420) alpha subunit
MRITTLRQFVKATNYKDPNQSVKLFVAASLLEGVVFLPFHFAGNCVNMLVNPAHGPIAQILEYEVCVVKLEKAAQSPFV